MEEWLFGHDVPDVILITPEALAQPQGRCMVNALAYASRLRAIVIDEVQCILSQKAFRPALNIAYAWRREGVPIIGLSGTLPSPLTAVLAEEMLFRSTGSYHVVRGEMDRANVSYRVEQTALNTIM